MIPRLPHWLGYPLVPERIEFWKDQPKRLHQRDVFVRQASGWNISLLAP